MARKFKILPGQDPNQVLQRIIDGAVEKPPETLTITEKFLMSQKGSKPQIKRYTGPLLKK